MSIERVGDKYFANCDECGWKSNAAKTEKRASASGRIHWTTRHKRTARKAARASKKEFSAKSPAMRYCPCCGLDLAKLEVALSVLER